VSVKVRFHDLEEEVEISEFEDYLKSKLRINKEDYVILVNGVINKKLEDGDIIRIIPVILGG